MSLAHEIRGLIYAATGVTASVGIGGSKLAARTATRLAKPDGAYFLASSDFKGVFSPCMSRVCCAFLIPFVLVRVGEAMPGVGYALSRRLEDAGVRTCGQLAGIDQARLQQIVGGAERARVLAEFARGVDKRGLENAPRKVRVCTYVFIMCV